MSRDAMQKALDALTGRGITGREHCDTNVAIDALRAALAETERQSTFVEAPIDPRDICRRMSAHSALTGVILGECPCIWPGETNREWCAELVIWDDSFTDSGLVAQWFYELGATDVRVSQTLHHECNGIEHGLNSDDVREWIIDFVVELKQ